MKTIINILCLFLLVSCVSNNSTCNKHTKEKLYNQEYYVGEFVDARADVVGATITEIKTTELFFVIHGLPQLKKGQQIKVRAKDGIIIQMQDCTGTWFNVYLKNFL